MTAIENFQRVDLDEVQRFVRRHRRRPGDEHSVALGYLQQLLYEVSNSRAAIQRVRHVQMSADMAAGIGSTAESQYYGAIYAGALADALDRESSDERHRI